MKSVKLPNVESCHRTPNVSAESHVHFWHRMPFTVNTVRKRIPTGHEWYYTPGGDHGGELEEEPKKNPVNTSAGAEKKNSGTFN